MNKGTSQTVTQEAPYLCRNSTQRGLFRHVDHTVNVYILVQTTLNLTGNTDPVSGRQHDPDPAQVASNDSQHHASVKNPEATLAQSRIVLTEESASVFKESDGPSQHVNGNLGQYSSTNESFQASTENFILLFHEYLQQARKGHLLVWEYDSMETQHQTIHIARARSGTSLHCRNLQLILTHLQQLATRQWARVELSRGYKQSKLLHTSIYFSVATYVLK